MTHAPIVVKDKVIAGVAGGEFGIRGFLAALDVNTGKEVWRFYTIPGPGEPGHETWSGDSWMHGGAPIWATGSYDPETNLTYWGTGNAGPDWDGDARLGDNLYSSSVIALDADTGKLKWHYQFSPHNEFDWDATQIPVLVDMPYKGRNRKVMLWANRNGMFYVIDRSTGRVPPWKPFAKVNWASGFDEKGRPIRVPGIAPSKQGTLVYPGNQGATNWYNPSYSPRTGLFYIPSWQNSSSIYVKGEAPPEFHDNATFSGLFPKVTNTGEDVFSAITRLIPRPARRSGNSGSPRLYGRRNFDHRGSRPLFAGGRDGPVRGHRLLARGQTSVGNQSGTFRVGRAYDLHGKWQAIREHPGR